MSRSRVKFQILWIWLSFHPWGEKWVGFFGKAHWTLAGTSSAFDHQRHSVYPSFTTLLVHQTTDPTMSCEFMLNQFLGSQTQIGDSPHQWDWEPCCFDIVAPKVRAGKSFPEFRGLIYKILEQGAEHRFSKWWNNVEFLLLCLGISKKARRTATNMRLEETTSTNGCHLASFASHLPFPLPFQQYFSQFIKNKFSVHQKYFPQFVNSIFSVNQKYLSQFIQKYFSQFINRISLRLSK